MKICACKKLMCFVFISLELFLIIAICSFKTAVTMSCFGDGSYNPSLLIPSNYNKDQTPLKEVNEPTYVYISLDIMDIDEIIEEKMEYSMQFYLNEYWKDGRLNMTFVENNERFQVPREWVPLLWLPDTIFENSKGGWIYPLSIPNVIVQIQEFGYLLRFTRYAMRVTCAMDLHYYPMDTQNCFLKISSLAYDTTQVMFKWLHERKEGNQGVKDLTLADLKPLKYHVADMSPGSTFTYWASVRYTQLYANFTFVRHLSSHIMNVYIPSGLVVILAFLTFWLNVKAVPARVALGLTSLLTLSTQASQSRSHLPQINYLTALDIWLFTCMILVFLSLLEFATVYHLSSLKVRKQRQTVKYNPSDESWAKRTRSISTSSTKEKLQGTTVSNRGKEISKEKSVTSVELEEEPEFLDRISRILFPTAFFTFLLVYWIHFLNSGS